MITGKNTMVKNSLHHDDVWIIFEDASICETFSDFAHKTGVKNNPPKQLYRTGIGEYLRMFYYKDGSINRLIKVKKRNIVLWTFIIAMGQACFSKILILEYTFYQILINLVENNGKVTDEFPAYDENDYSDDKFIDICDTAHRRRHQS
ncbi:hypothetical protein A3Q56_07608 [Intoshia linei]|uniref:Uncharacterized protein n=1 Tax=Intoshia linei TaxID=1819745 RepID=A0A177AS81_9BILA|nr:hypothetical protein A3Q56_07608 [Intoshia linei]